MTTALWTESWTASVEVCRPVRFLSDSEPGSSFSTLVIALHGYGMNPVRMLEWTRLLIGPEPALIAIEAPNAAHLGPDPRTAQTGYNWGIRETTEFHVAFHHRIVAAVLKAAELKFSVGARRTILAGFSQPVGLNYRYAAAFPQTIGGVLALCGGVPDEWDQAAVRPLPLSIFHVARTEDEFYPQPTIDVFAERLRRSAADVTMLRLPGPHRFPRQATQDVRAWLSRLS